MKEIKTFNYGPLTGLIGTWVGDKGKDIAPEPDNGSEINLYHETIVFKEAFDLDNAEEQHLSAVHYELKVVRIDGGKVIHQETGYWLWEVDTNKVIHSFTIPRGVSVLAGGEVTETDAGDIIFNVSAREQGDWQISQAPFMHNKAKIKTFDQRFTLKGDQLSYTQSMLLDIYGREFDHTDENSLTKEG
jgi:hypothetical protein